METVFHLSSGSIDDWKHGLGNVDNFVADRHVTADPVLVVNGDAAYALVGGSPVADRVRDLLTEGVEVCVCSNSLAGRDLDPEALVGGVDMVSSAMGELTRRQEDGAAYVKVP